MKTDTWDQRKLESGGDQGRIKFHKKDFAKSALLFGSLGAYNQRQVKVVNYLIKHER